MSVTTLEQLGPVLASELPPAPPVPSYLHTFRTSVRERVSSRLAERRFERALMRASTSERQDLVAASRRQ